MAIRVDYRADQADRNYGRVTTQTFTDLRNALLFAGKLSISDLVAVVDLTTGQSVLQGAINLVLGLPANAPVSAAYTYIPAGWGGQWRAARSQLPSRPAKLQAYGDSITVGQVTSDLLNRGWWHMATDTLKSAFGDGGTGYVPHGTAPTTTGTWADELGFSGAASRATATATKTWPAVRGTTIRIYYRNIGVSGSFRYRVDGGSYTVITPPTAPTGNEPGSVEITGLSASAHTLDVEWVSGSFVLHGIEGTYGTGIASYCCAQGSRNATDYSANEIQRLSVNTTSGSNALASTAPGSFTPFMVGKYISGTNILASTTITGVSSATAATMSQNASGTGTGITAMLSWNPATNSTIPFATTEASPARGFGRADVLFISLGVVDALTDRDTAASVRNGISHIIGAHTLGNVTYDYAPDVVFIVENTGFSQGFDVDIEYPEYAAIIRSMADAFDAAVIDFWAMGKRSYQGAVAKGWMADLVHPNSAGHAVIAKAVTDLLLN